MTEGILQPNSKMCFLCGLENPVGLKLRIYETEQGVVESTYTAPDHFQGYPGVLHGGIVATMIDEISGRAWMGPEDNPRFMFTAKTGSNIPQKRTHRETATYCRQSPEEQRAQRGSLGWDL